MTKAAPKFSKLKSEYERLWESLEIKEEWLPQLNRWVDRITAARGKYENVSEKTGVPWYVIATWHMRESGCNFSKHLHNGDPLSARTVHVPPGRPLGTPPFTWDESAVDALAMKGFSSGKSVVWDIARICYETERYNGFGYRKPKMPLSPYLWQGTHHYDDEDSPGGKYVRDHVYDSRADDQQCGAIALLYVLMLSDTTIRLPTVKSVTKTVKDSPSLRSVLYAKLALLVAFLWNALAYAAHWTVEQVEWLFGILPDKTAQAEEAVSQAQRVSALLQVPWHEWVGVAIAGSFLAYVLWRQIGQKRVAQ